jgi:hypothetical protein
MRCCARRVSLLRRTQRSSPTRPRVAAARTRVLLIGRSSSSQTRSAARSQADGQSISPGVRGGWSCDARIWAKAQALRSASAAYPSLLDPREAVAQTKGVVRSHQPVQAPAGVGLMGATLSGSGVPTRRISSSGRQGVWLHVTNRIRCAGFVRHPHAIAAASRAAVRADACVQRWCCSRTDCS